MQDGRPRVLRDSVGDRTFPSVVAYTAGGTWLVGKAARRQSVTNARNTVFAAKRLIGREYDSRPVSNHRAAVPYEVVRGERGGAMIRLGERDYAPQEISARVLRHVKEAATAELGEEVESAVITVPAYFDDAQRQATAEAAEVAGLETLAIINEPTAACLAYGLQRQIDDAVVAVFDLGGGTFDISIVKIAGTRYEVLATAGDSLLGGEDFDAALLGRLVGDFMGQSGIDVSNDATAMQRLREAAEAAKIELSAQSSAAINLPFLATTGSGPVHFEHTVPRELFETLIEPTLGRVDSPCQQALSDAGLSPDKIDQVLLVGGSTRVPAVQALAARIFDRQPVKEANPDEVVALGAATQCGSMSGASEPVTLVDVTPHSLGIKVDNARLSIVIPRNTSIPVSEKRTYKTFEDGQTFVEVEVFQGEEELADDNRGLGAFRLDGLPKRPAGEVRVEVTFTIDADGILNVEAQRVGSAKAKALTVDSSTSLPSTFLEGIANIEAPSVAASGAVDPGDWFNSEFLPETLPPPSMPQPAAPTATSAARESATTPNATTASPAKAEGKPGRRQRSRRGTAAHTPSSKSSRVDAQSAELAALASADCFVQLGGHWTDPPAKLDSAIANLRSQYGPGSKAYEQDPGSAQRRLEIAETAYSTLATPSDRRKYRAEKMAVDVAGAAELLTQQAKLDARRQDFLDAEDKLRAAVDLEPNGERKRLLEQTLEKARAAAAS